MLATDFITLCVSNLLRYVIHLIYRESIRYNVFARVRTSLISKKKAQIQTYLTSSTDCILMSLC